MLFQAMNVLLEAIRVFIEAGGVLGGLELASPYRGNACRGPESAYKVVRVPADMQCRGHASRVGNF